MGSAAQCQVVRFFGSGALLWQNPTIKTRGPLIRQKPPPPINMSGPPLWQAPHMKTRSPLFWKNDPSQTRVVRFFGRPLNKEGARCPCFQTALGDQDPETPTVDPEPRPWPRQRLSSQRRLKCLRAIVRRTHLQRS
eukprot:362094-Chlamydomonas_euryale.AAC.14